MWRRLADWCVPSHALTYQRTLTDLFAAVHWDWRLAQRKVGRHVLDAMRTATREMGERVAALSLGVPPFTLTIDDTPLLRTADAKTRADAVAEEAHNLARGGIVRGDQVRIVSEGGCVRPNPTRPVREWDERPH